MAVAAVWKATPREKTKHAKIKPSLRPTPSATGAASNAPKKVPAERIDLCGVRCVGWIFFFGDREIKDLQKDRVNALMIEKSIVAANTQNKT